MALHFEERTLCIIVVPHGHVFVGRVEGGKDGTLRVYNPRIIRQWGVENGLGQLYNGPTKKTVLDARVPLMFLPVEQTIYAFPVCENPDWGV